MAPKRPDPPTPSNIQTADKGAFLGAAPRGSEQEGWARGLLPCSLETNPGLQEAERSWYVILGPAVQSPGFPGLPSKSTPTHGLRERAPPHVGWLAGPWRKALLKAPLGHLSTEASLPPWPSLGT